MVRGSFPVSCPPPIYEFLSLHPRYNYIHLINLPKTRSAGCFCSKGNWVVLFCLQFNHALLDGFPNPFPLVIPVLQGSKKKHILLSSEPLISIPLNLLFSLYNCFGTVICQVHFRSQSKHWLRQGCKYLLMTLGSHRNKIWHKLLKLDLPLGSLYKD